MVPYLVFVLLLTLLLKRYTRMFERMGMGDHSYVINLILLKICNNLKVYADEEGIVRKSLQVWVGRLHMLLV